MTDVQTLVTEWVESQRADRTRVQYRDGITRWLEFLAAKDPLTARGNDLDRYRNHLAALKPRPNSDRTIAKKMAVVSSWYLWLEGEGHIGVNPMLRVKRPKVDQRQGTTEALSMDGAAAILKAAEDAGPGTHVAVAVLLSTAIRARELLGLDLSKVKVAGDGTMVLTVKRKGGKSDEVPLPERVAHDVEALRGRRRKGPLLTVGDTGAPWSYWQLYRAVRAAGRAAGLGPGVTPHVLRHSCAMHTLAATGDIRKVALWLGHASIQSTETYLRADPEEKLQILAAHGAPTIKPGLFKPPSDALITMLTDVRRRA